MARGADVYKPVLRDAAGDPRGEVRALACRFLVEGWSEPSEVVPMLTAAAGDGQELVRLEAAQGLGRLARGGRIRAGPGSLPGAPAPAQRDHVLRTLRRLLKDSSSLVRAEAAGPLALFGPDPAIAADLVAALGDDDRAVRLAAAQALLQVNGPDDPAAARALIAMAASPDAVPDRQEVLRVIRTMGDAVQDRAVAALVDLLSRADPDILPDVIASLPEAGPRAKPAVPALEALLEHAEPGLRAGAAMAILAIESPEDFRALQGAAPGGMGLAAMGTMGGGGGMVMGPGGAAGATDPAAEGQMNPRIVAILARIVGDAAIGPEARQNALGMIRMAGTSAVAKTSSDLVRQLADPDPNVRRTAVELLSQIIDVAPASLPAASGAK
jgi:HEAT repeat protein